MSQPFDGGSKGWFLGFRISVSLELFEVPREIEELLKHL